MQLTPKLIFSLGLLFSFLDIGITLYAFQLGFHEISPQFRLGLGLPGPSLFLLEPLVIVSAQASFLYLSKRWGAEIGQYLAFALIFGPLAGFLYDLLLILLKNKATVL